MQKLKGGYSMLNRRTFIKSIALGSIGLYTLPSYALKKRNIEKLLILHTNDLHCRVEPFSVTDPKYPNQGGMTRVAAYVKKMRESDPELLLFDSGDFSQGTPFFNFYKDEVILKLMSEMGYNASTIGNHEFDNGVDELAKGLAFARFPIVSSNYDFSETPMKGKVKKNLILERKGIKIGVYGLGVELSGLVDKGKSGNTRYLDPLQIALEQEEHLRMDEKCDLVICLSHLGYEYANEKISDIRLANQTHFTDLILGGHSHTFLEKPVSYSNADNKPVIINQAGWAALMLGQLEFTFERHKKSIFNFAENKKIG
jgi:5'-nucleotidase